MSNSPGGSVFWRASRDGVTVAVKVQPRSRRAGVRGVVISADGPRLGISVTEAAEDGKATRSACAVLAEALGVASSLVQLVKGATSREKLLSIRGDPALLAGQLEALGQARVTLP